MVSKNTDRPRHSPTSTARAKAMTMANTARRIGSSAATSAPNTMISTINATGSPTDSARVMLSWLAVEISACTASIPVMCAVSHPGVSADSIAARRSSDANIASPWFV